MDELTFVAGLISGCIITLFAVRDHRAEMSCVRAATPGVVNLPRHPTQTEVESYKLGHEVGMWDSFTEALEILDQFQAAVSSDPELTMLSRAAAGAVIQRASHLVNQRKAQLKDPGKL